MTTRTIFCLMCNKKLEDTFYGFPLKFPVFPFHYIALAVFLIITIFFGIILRFLHKVPPFEWLLHKRLFYPIKRRWIPAILEWIFQLSIGELFFVWMYLALNAVWAAYGILLANSRPWSKIGIAVYFSPIASVSSQLLILNCTFVVIPATRNSILKLLFGQSFERALAYHRYVSAYFISLICVHGATYLIWTSLDSHTTWKYIFTWKWYDGGNVLFGFVSFCFFLPLGLLSLPVVRRKLFELFFASHIVFAILGITAAVLHNYAIGFHVGAGVILYLIDLSIRFYQIAFPAKIISLRQGKANTIIVEIEKKGFTFEAGQFIFLNVPKISWVQFHPFTITSAPSSDGRFTLHVKSTTSGQWCDKLLNLAKDFDPAKPLMARVQGPYGIATINPDNYKVLVFCSGGIGVAPNISYLQNLIKPKDSGHFLLQKIYFNWTARDASQFANFKDVLLKVKEMAPHVQISLYSSRNYTSSPFEDVGFPIQKGRPNYRKLIRQVKEENPDCNLIGVLTCGTEEMMNAVEMAVFQENGCKQRIHFHKEEYVF